MKQRLTTIAFVLFALPLTTYAQWVPGANPNDITNTNTGNVGVGTNTPQSKLEIKAATSGTTASAFHVTAANGLSRFFVRNDGRVGIGTSAPREMLEVKLGNILLDDLNGKILGNDGLNRGGTLVLLNYSPYDPQGLRAINGFRAEAASPGETPFAVHSSYVDGVQWLIEIQKAGPYPARPISVVDERGKFGIGYAWDRRSHPNGSIPASLDVTEVHNLSPDRGIMSSQHSTTPDGALFRARKSRGGQISPLKVQPGDDLGSFFAEAYDGTPYTREVAARYILAGGMRVTAEGATGVGRVPSRLSFWTTPDLPVAADAPPNAPQERMRIDSAGNVSIGTTAPKAKLHVAGKVYVESNGQGVILKSPNGVCYEMTVSDAGALQTVGVPCP